MIQCIPILPFNIFMSEENEYEGWKKRVKRMNKKIAKFAILLNECKSFFLSVFIFIFIFTLKICVKT